MLIFSKSQRENLYLTIYCNIYFDSNDKNDIFLQKRKGDLRIAFYVNINLSVFINLKILG